MTLKELQTMIKEEFDAYMGEQEDDVDVSVSDNDVDAEMGDMDDEGAEDMLRKIYDMLKDKFEAEEDMGDEEAEDVEADEDMNEEADLEENSTTAAQYQKTGMAAGGPKSAGKDAGYGAVGGKGSTGYDAGSKALQERFKRLANIIK